MQSGPEGNRLVPRSKGPRPARNRRTPARKGGGWAENNEGWWAGEDKSSTHVPSSHHRVQYRAWARRRTKDTTHLPQRAAGRQACLKHMTVRPGKRDVSPRPWEKEDISLSPGKKRDICVFPRKNTISIVSQEKGDVSCPPPAGRRGCVSALREKEDVSLSPQEHGMCFCPPVKK